MIRLMMSLTCQLCSDSLEGQLSEFLYQRPDQSAADQLMFSVIQLVDGNHPVGQNPLHLYTVPTGQRQASVTLSSIKHTADHPKLQNVQTVQGQQSRQRVYLQIPVTIHVTITAINMKG